MKKFIENYSDKFMKDYSQYLISEFKKFWFEFIKEKSSIVCYTFNLMNMNLCFSNWKIWFTVRPSKNWFHLYIFNSWNLKKSIEWWTSSVEGLVKKLYKLQNM